MHELIEKNFDKKKSDNQLLIQEIERLKTIRKFKEDEIDRLEEYVRCRVQAYRMRLLIEKEGEIFVSERGGSYMNPRVCLLQGVLNRMDKLRDKLFPVIKNEVEEVKDIRDVL